MALGGLKDRNFLVGEWLVRPDLARIEREGASVHVTPRSMAVLVCLASAGDRVLSRNDLLDAVWPGAAVTPDALSQCIVELRKAFRDDSRSPSVIETIPKIGVRLIAPVTVVQPPAAADTRDGSWPETIHAPPSHAAVLAPGHEVPPQHGATARTPPVSWRRWPTAAAMACALAIIGGWAVWSTHSPGASAPATARALAVLPFADLSPGGDQEYLGDGFAEEILNLLAQGSDLPVIARTSSFSFKGQNADVAAIAARLNVTHVLEGSVRKAGNRLRITAQLVDAATGAHLWSESYDRDLGDVFALQTEIASTVAAALRTTLNGSRRAGTAAPDPRAWEHYLLGRYFFNRRRAGDFERAEEAYSKAIELDPAFARGWAGLAGVYNLQAYDYDSPPQALLAKLGEAANEALRLDPELAEAHVRRASLRFMAGDFTGAREDFDRAVQLEPDHPLVLGWLAGFATREHRLEDAVELNRRVVAQDPLSIASRQNYGIALYFAGRFDAAEAEARAAQRILGSSPPAVDEPDRSLALDVARSLIAQQRFGKALAYVELWLAGHHRDYCLVLVHHALGNRDSANAALARLLAADGADLWHGHRLVEAYAYRGDLEEAFERLANLLQGHDSTVALPFSWKEELRYSPFTGSLHGDPRWQAWLAEGN